jgi:type III restriction enzyme
MSSYEVPQPILNSPFEEPARHWRIVEGETPEILPRRRPAMYWYREPKRPRDREGGPPTGTAIELKLVNRIRERLKQWRADGCPGASATTRDLLAWWTREGRERRLFFAQREAAETIIFLREARADYLQGIDIPRDDPSAEQQADGNTGFRRLACKMATGSGKTTVMAMVAAWSILNKVNDRRNSAFSDVVLAICPNVTIRNRLAELDPELGDASLYRTRDLVPDHLMPLLRRGRVLVYNWHILDPQQVSTAGVSSRVVKAGRPVVTRERVTIALETGTVRGSRQLTEDDYRRQVALGLLEVVEEVRNRDGSLKHAFVRSTRYVESDTALVARILGREVGGKKNILVLNDEAHHAYRIRPEEEPEEEVFEGEEDADYFQREATVWIDGLDRINKVRGINFCVDLSATPYFLSRVGQQTNRTFPWVVSEFGLIDAIESGLVKIPQLAVRDTTGRAIPGYFNIWDWVLPQLTPAERGATGTNPRPEAILKYAHTPIAMLAGLWLDDLARWESEGEPRPPVFIIVCKNTRIAKVIFEWLGEDSPPAGIPASRVEALKNKNGDIRTIRVDSKVVQETDSGEARGDESRWMRLTLDTVGRQQWPTDRSGAPIYPEGFEELAGKLKRPLHPPGKEVRAIVSVGMLTEGWDCNTVTHIVGLRPFTTQLLCEQVVGRGLRRKQYEPLDENGLLTEEVAKVFGVPFEVIPFKANPTSPVPEPRPRWHVRALPERGDLEIRFPRVIGYSQGIRNRIRVDWDQVPRLSLNPLHIPPEVEMKGGIPNNQGRPSLVGPGRLERVDLNPYRSGTRRQELVFEMAADLTRDYVKQPTCTAPAHVLFPQLVRVIERYLNERVDQEDPWRTEDVFLSPYYGWAVEQLVVAIRADTELGEAPELPRYETNRGEGSTAEVNYFTVKEPREVVKSHVNYVVPDTQQWEQSAAYYLDSNDRVEAFVKNSGLGFAIPYFHNGQDHDYLPDFLVRLHGSGKLLILETKGYDSLRDVKKAAAERWVAAVNADLGEERWVYKMVSHPSDIPGLLAAL